jgi:DNA-binding SARP family transcriptional activator/Tfp pilus assembly protein PilF
VTGAGPRSSDTDVRILGPLEIESGRRPVALAGPRQQRLLATLIVNANGIVPVSRLVDVLWEEPPASAHQQIHNSVGALRRALAAVADVEIVTGPAGYKIAVPDSAIDSVRFTLSVEQARAAAAADHADEAVALLSGALAEWRGPALAGLADRQLAGVAQRLDEQRLAAIDLLMSLRLDRGEATGLVGELFELVAEHPLRESLRASLMLALWRAGRQADGLAVFEEGRRLLAEELGLDPGPALRAVHEQILAGTAEASRTAAAGAAAAGRPPAPELPAPPGPAPGTAGKATTGPATADPPGLAAPAGPTPEAPVPAPEPTPVRACYLPHDVAEFAGRGDELTRLLADADRPATSALVISAIDGMGGVGKTTVAVHLAHQVADQYPDGQFFVDLHGFTAGMEPLSPLQALGTLLRDAGTRDDLIPSDLAGRSSLWRSQLAHTRSLVLLDNAVDASQVRPLLPGTSGTLVLITSRRKLTALEGAVPVALDVLSPADAVELFGKVAGADRARGDPAAVAAAVELCGRLPLAIRIAAARLRDRHSWTVDYLVQQLRSSSRRARLLATGDRRVLTVLGMSYKYLSTEQRQLFRLLSLHPGGDFDAHCAAGVAELPLDVAEAALESLFEDNLVLQHSPGRYQFHDLIRDCARELSGQEDSEATRENARRRLLDHYLASAQRWSALLAKGPFRHRPEDEAGAGHVKVPRSDEEAVALFRDEYQNLLATARLAEESGAAGHSWRFACALQPYFRLLNYGAEAIDVFSAGLRAARATGASAGESACLTGLALAGRARGDNAGARGRMRQAIALSRAAGDRSAEAYQLADLGTMHLNEFHFEDAHRCFLRARELAVETGDRQALADATNNLGVVCRDRGSLDEALRHFDQTLRLDRRTNSRSSQAVTLNNIGLLLHLLGRYPEARRHFAEALALSETVSSRYGQAFAYIGLCLVHRSLGDVAGACDHGRRALELARDAGLYDVEWDALNCLGDALLSRGDLRAAESLFRQAEASAAERNSTRHVGRARDGLAHVWFARHDLGRARRAWESALEAFPAGVSDADGSRRHLAGDSGVTCPRCHMDTDGLLLSTAGS